MPVKKSTEMKVGEEEFVEHAKKDAMKAMEIARERFKQAESEMERAIKKDPVRASVIAAGLGAAIGAAVAFALMKKRKE